MARNKHPEETVNLILDVAFRLFMEKGYEHTSIQDIIDNLGGLSKGAIYHHFKSKEDIMAYLRPIGLIGLIEVCLVSCRTKSVSVPEYHTEYKVRTDSFIKKDSVWVHDSVSVWMKGDTVFKEKLKKVYNEHYIYTNKTDTVMKTDSVRVPFPVEKKLGRWEQMRINSFVPLCVMLFIVCAILVWIIRKRNKT